MSVCVCVSRKHGQVGVFGGGGGGGGSAAKIVLTLDDLVFINTTLSRRVSHKRSLSLAMCVSVLLIDFVCLIHFQFISL